MIQNSLLDYVGEGEGWMIWENGIEICIISYMKRVASPGSMQDTGCLGLVHWDDPEGWYGEGGGRRVQDVYLWHVYLWQIHFDIWQNQYNIVKLNKIKLKKKSSHRITWSQNIQIKIEKKKKSYRRQIQKLQREIDIFHSVIDRTS